MSLENQIASLVSAANALTAAVNGKIAQIDQKNEAFVASFDANLRGALSKSYYVNASTGLDTNPGTASSPKKTISGVIGSIPSGSTVDIYLADSNIYKVKGVACHGINLNFRKWGSGSSPIIVSEGIAYDGETTYSVGFRLHGCRLTFRDCVVDTGDFIEGNANAVGWSGFFGRTDTSNGYVFLFNCEILLRTAPLLSIPTGGALFDLSFYNVVLRRTNSVVSQTTPQVPVIRNEAGSPVRIHWSAVVLDNVKYSELVSHPVMDSAGRITNILCPVDLAAHNAAGT